MCLDDGSRSSRSTVVEASYMQKTDSESSLHFPLWFRLQCRDHWRSYVFVSVYYLRRDSAVKIIQLLFFHVILLLQHQQKSGQVSKETSARWRRKVLNPWLIRLCVSAPPACSIARTTRLLAVAAAAGWLPWSGGRRSDARS